jgi:flagellar operon protein
MQNKEGMHMRSFDVDFLSMGQAANLYFQNVKPEKTTESNKEAVSFQEVLNAKFEQKVKFSKHANQRLENRNIELSEDQLERLNQGVGQARTKQIQESLVMMDNLAFIVNVKNNTVITAMEQGESGQVFTNIDGAVIV